MEGATNEDANTVPVPQATLELQEDEGPEITISVDIRLESDESEEDRGAARRVGGVTSGGMDMDRSGKTFLFYLKGSLCTECKINVKTMMSYCSCNTSLR